MPEVKSMEQIWQEEKEKPCSYTESALAAMSAWEQQQSRAKDERIKELEEQMEENLTTFNAIRTDLKDGTLGRIFVEKRIAHIHKLLTK